MYGRKMLSVYARDLKPGMVTVDNGTVVRNRGVAPQWYHARSWTGKGLGLGEPLNIGIRYAGRVGVHIVAPHDIVQLERL